MRAGNITNNYLLKKDMTKKFDIPNLLPKKEKKNKINWVISGILIVLAFIILLITLVKATKKAQAFFEVNTIKFNQLIKLELNNPISIISKKEIQEEKELEEKANKVADECIKLLLTPTPEKKKSGIIKQVEAIDIYTYPKFKNMPYYDAVILKLQGLYINWQTTAELIGKESSFDIYAVNPTSGACGLTQALPCKKMGCNLSDIDCQLKWQKEYIANRYGTVDKALSFWKVNNWY